MTYIRTKNRIVKAETIADIQTKVIWKDNFVKQADNIEELCDGFIFKDTEANELHFLDKNEGISLFAAALFIETVRGYIETDKGLIYVAKMNEEGEFELL